MKTVNKFFFSIHSIVNWGPGTKTMITSEENGKAFVNMLTSYFQRKQLKRRDNPSSLEFLS